MVQETEKKGDVSFTHGQLCIIVRNYIFVHNMMMSYRLIVFMGDTTVSYRLSVANGDIFKRVSCQLVFNKLLDLIFSTN